MSSRSPRLVRRVAPLTALALVALAAIVGFVPGCAAETDDGAWHDHDADGDGDIDEADGPDETDSEDVATTELGLTGAFAPTAEATQTTRIKNRRANLGRRALRRRACLNAIARAWTTKIAAAGKLSHNPNLGKQVTSKCTGLRWRGLGENVGFGPSEASVWQAFLTSSGHRANIDKAAWDSMGIGIYRRGDGTVFITQVFADF